MLKTVEHRIWGRMWEIIMYDRYHMVVIIGVEEVH